MITTAHAQKVVIFHNFHKPMNKKIKELRPKKAKIASRSTAFKQGVLCTAKKTTPPFFKPREKL